MCPKINSVGFKTLRWNLQKTRPCGILRCFAAVFFVFTTAWAQQQQQQALDGCAGALGSPQFLSSLSTRQLVDGALLSPVQALWDFESQQLVVMAAAGASVNMSCLAAVNVKLAGPTGSPSFLQPTAIDLTAATGLSMDRVSLSTDCGTVLAYQEYFCSTHSVAGSLTLEPGVVLFSQWQDGFTSLRNVNITCLAPNQTAPQPPCRLAAVQTAQQLLEAFAEYATLVKTDVSIVLAANISLFNSSWPTSPVTVTTNVTLVGSSRLTRPVLDFQLMIGVWELVPPATVVLVDLTCANIAPSYFSPMHNFSHFGMLSERVWAFRRFEQRLHIVNTTLVVPQEELEYTKYWVTFLVSPVPEAQARASWYRVIDIKVSSVNSSGIYYDTVMAYTATYTNVRLTANLSGSYPLLPQVTGLSQFKTQSVPLSAVTPVINASDFAYAMHGNYSIADEQGRRWVVMVNNFSVIDAFATAAFLDGSSSSGVSTLALPGIMVIESHPRLQAARLGLGGLVGSLSIPAGTTLHLAKLVLSDLPTRHAAYEAQDPLAVLASPLWGLGIAAGASSDKVVLENCTLLVSPDELRLLQTSLLPANETQSLPGQRTYDGALVAAVRSFFLAPTVGSCGPSHLVLTSGRTPRYSMTGVTFRLPVAADGEAAAGNFTAMGVPYGKSGGGGLAGWAVGVLVGCLVGGGLLLSLAALLFVRWRRRRGSGTDGGSIAYSKYLRGSADLGERPVGGGGGSDLMPPSQELTHSSQALRPGARNSDVEAVTAEIAGLKIASGRASASGDGTATGSQTPTTLVACRNSISGVRSGSGVADAAAAAGGSGARLPSVHGVVLPVTGSSSAHDRSQGTDSFERPPTTTFLGQHGFANRANQKLSQATGGDMTLLSTGHVPSMGSVSTPTRTGQSITPSISHSIFSSGGGRALEQMHQMIQVLGREFNDQQLEVNGLLGKGAHGTVYKGKWRGLPIAVKSMIFSSDSSARQQQRPLMEAAISSNLAHSNIVTTYSYELREVEHELASLSPELARQGGGWRLLIIQEYCDAGPLRKLVDCGFFLAPQKSSRTSSKFKRHGMGLLWRELPSAGAAGEGSMPAGADTAAAAPPPSRSSSNDSSGNPPTSRDEVDAAARVSPHASPRVSGSGCPGGAPLPRVQAAAANPELRPALEDLPADVPARPSSSLQAALRYVEAALMIARGLLHMHTKNIVHGDLNPNNVLLVRAPDTPLGFCLKVSDFGLSLRMSEGESHLSNLFQGSPYYCAPETVLSGKIGKSADVYSLGIMLWELQNGTRPPWRRGVRLRTFPSLNTAELEFGSETPPPYVRLTRECFHASKDARPEIAEIVKMLAAIKADLDAKSTL